MADVASKQQNHGLVFIHHSHTHKKTHRTHKKTDKPGEKPVLCQKIFSSVFRSVVLHSYTAQFNLDFSVDEDLPVMMKLRTPCMCGCESNRKRSSQKGSEGWRTAEQKALKKKGGIC
jgi:hypothetical protein